MTPNMFLVQARYFDQMGSIAAEHTDCPCGCTISGQGIAQAIWSMSSWLRHRAEIEEQKQQIMLSDAASKLKAARGDN